jgi:CRP/FNR family transcriptional regulator, cyclic AMP receptor protein
MASGDSSGNENPALAALAGKWSAPKPKASDWVPILAEMPLFSGLGNRQLRKIAELADIVEFAPNAQIIQIGAPGDALFLILSGEARVLGRKGGRRVFRAGDFFGEMSLLDGDPRSATVQATSEVQAMRIRHRPLLKLLEREPKITLLMMRELSRRLRNLQRQAVE